MAPLFSVHHLATQHKSGIDTLLSLSNAAFGNAEKLITLNMSTVRSALEDSAAQAKAAYNSNESFQTALSEQPKIAFAKMTSYLEDVRQIVGQSQQELAEILEAQRTEASESLLEAIDEFAKSGPAGSSYAASTLKSLFAMTNSAYDKFNTTAKQVVEIGEAQLAAATAKTLGAPSPRTRKAA